MKHILLIIFVCVAHIVVFAQSNVSAPASYDMERKEVAPPIRPATHKVTEQVREHVNSTIIAKQKEWTDHIQVTEHEDTIRTAFVQTETTAPNIKKIILFDKAKDIVRPEFCQLLDVFIPNYIKLLRQNKVKAIYLRGFASTEGEYQYNMDLSYRRARSVLVYCLGVLGKADGRWLQQTVTLQGCGPVSPIISPNGEEDRVHSRRVEIDVVIEE